MKIQIFDFCSYQEGYKYVRKTQFVCISETENVFQYKQDYMVDPSMASNVGWRDSTAPGDEASNVGWPDTTDQAYPPWHGQANQTNIYLKSRPQYSVQKPFQCKLCAKKYISESGLKHHMISHQGKKFLCPVCDTKFTQKFSIKNHLKNVHKSAQCLTCSRVFRLPDEYNAHVLKCK